MVLWMVTATMPELYAIEPQTTKVPTEKKLIKRDSPLIHQGTAPPAAKKDLALPPLRENDKPSAKTSRENTRDVAISNVLTMLRPFLQINDC